MEYKSQKNEISLKDNFIFINDVQNKNKKIYKYIILLFFIFFPLLLIMFYEASKHQNFAIISLNEKFLKQKNIDSDYERVSPNDEKYIYIPLISTSDFHGRFFPQINEITYNSKKIIYKTGGLEYTAKYINILRDEFGKNRVLYFDIGDQFFQTNETILFNGINIIDFLNKIGLNGTVLGNHEFIYRRDWIEKK